MLNRHEEFTFQELNIPLISFAFSPKSSELITNSVSEVQINERPLPLQQLQIGAKNKTLDNGGQHKREMFCHSTYYRKAKVKSNLSKCI